MFIILSIITYECNVSKAVVLDFVGHTRPHQVRIQFHKTSLLKNKTMILFIQNKNMAYWSTKLAVYRHYCVQRTKPVQFMNSRQIKYLLIKATL